MRMQERLAGIMAERGVSQNAVARMSGLSAAAISRYVNGTRSPTLDALLKLADGLGMTLSELLEGVDG